MRDRGAGMDKRGCGERQGCSKREEEGGMDKRGCGEGQGCSKREEERGTREGVVRDRVQ